MDTNDLEVYYVSWPVVYDHLQPYTILNQLSGRTNTTDWLNVNGLLISDEAQGSYNSSLRNDLIKFIDPGFRLIVLWFCVSAG